MHAMRIHLKTLISGFLAATVLSLVVATLVHFHHEYVFHKVPDSQKLVMILDKKDTQTSLKKIKFHTGSFSNYFKSPDIIDRQEPEGVQLVEDFSSTVFDEHPDLMSGYTLRPPPEA